MILSLFNQELENNKEEKSGPHIQCWVLGWDLWIWYSGIPRGLQSSDWL